MLVIISVMTILQPTLFLPLTLFISVYNLKTTYLHFGFNSNVSMGFKVMKTYVVGILKGQPFKALPLHCLHSLREDKCSKEGVWNKNHTAPYESAADLLHFPFFRINSTTCQLTKKVSSWKCKKKVVIVLCLPPADRIFGWPLTFINETIIF